MPRLTEKMINITQAPDSGQIMLRNDDLKGFGLRITPNKKTYIVDSRVNGIKRRVTIGRCDLMSLEDARKEARKLLGEMASGFDPHAEKRNEKVSSITLIELLEEYLAVRQLKPTTVKVYRRVIKKSLKEWLNKPITDTGGGVSSYFTAPDYQIANNVKPVTAAAPLMSAIIARINQQIGRNAGFIHPIITSQTPRLMLSVVIMTP